MKTLKQDWWALCLATGIIPLHQAWDEHELERYLSDATGVNSSDIGSTPGGNGSPDSGIHRSSSGSRSPSGRNEDTSGEDNGNHPFSDTKELISGLKPGHWIVISKNTIRDVDPCPSRDCSYSAVEGIWGVIDDWNGGAFATRFGSMGGLVVWGGGHNGYFGNEVYVFNLATQLWERHSEPVKNPVCNQGTGELQDGSPCSRHTYDYVEYHPKTNSFLSLGSASNHDMGGGGVSRVHLYSFDTGKWRRGARLTPNFSSQGASSAYDPNRDVFWLLTVYSTPFAKYDPNANNGEGLWTAYQDVNISIDTVSAIDPIRDLFVALDTREDNRVLVFDLKNPAAQPITVKTIGDKTLEDGNKPGFEWDPVAGKFVGWDGGATIYTLSPPATGDWAKGSWVWERVDPAPTNNVVPTSGNETGTYSRFRYADTINAFLVVNSVDGPVYLYRHVAK